MSIERQRRIKHYAEQITQILETDFTLKRRTRIENLLALFAADCDADNTPAPPPEDHAPKCSAVERLTRKATSN